MQQLYLQSWFDKYRTDKENESDDSDEQASDESSDSE